MKSLTLMLTVAALLNVAPLARAQIAASDDAGADRIVKQQRARDSAVLTLRMRDLPEPSMAALLRYNLYTKPAAGGSTDLATFVTYLPSSSAPETLIWITYDALHRMTIAPTFAAAFLTGSSKQSLLFFSKSTETRTLLSAYVLDLKKSITPLPLHLDPERKEEWPTPSKPLSQISYELPKNEALQKCVLTDLDVIVRDDAVSVRGKRSPAACRPLVCTFDQISGTWSTVTISDTNSE